MKKNYSFYIIICIILLIIMAVDIANAATDTTINNICKMTNYLPVNKQRVADPNIIGFDKNNNFLVASNWSNCGISRYDGTNWTYWDKTTGLKTDKIHALFNDSKGNTWISSDSGVSVHNGTTIKNIEVDKQSVYSICEDRNGILWFFTSNNTAYKYVGDSISKAEIPFSEYVKSATFDKDSNMWVAISSGIWKYNGKTWTGFTTDNGLFQNNVRIVTVVHDSVFCLYDYGPATDSISKFDGTKWVRFPSPGTDGIFGLINIVEDNNKNLWLLAVGNRDLLRYSNGVWDYIAIGMYVPVYWPRAIGADKNGTVYIANQLGRVAKYKDGLFTLIENNLNKGIGYVDPASPLIDKKNNLWVVPASSMGASRFDGKKWTYFAQDTLTGIWRNNQVLGTALDTFGNVYTGGPSLAKFDGSKWSDYGFEITLKYGLEWNSSFRNIFFDRSNNLWYYASNKIVRVNENSYKEFTKNDSLLLDNFVNRIIQDKDGNVWVLYEGIRRASKFDGDKWSNINLPVSYINDAACDTAGNIWFVGNAVAVMSKSGEFKVYSNLNSKLLPYNIARVHADKYGRMYFLYKWSDKMAIFVNNSFKNFTFTGYENLSAIDFAVNRNGEVFVTSSNHGALKVNFQLENPEITKKDIVCVGADNGNITLHPGENGYVYSIDGGKNYLNDTVFNNLTKGTYKVIAKANKCYSTPVEVNINQPAGSYDVTLTYPTCFGFKNGSIKITTSGLDSIKFKWSNGVDTSFLENLGKGNYSVAVSYKKNCEFVKTYSIKEPDSLKLKASFLNDCGNKGEIDVTITGGTKPYKIKWSTNDTINVLKNLTAGNYKISVVDAAKCFISDSVFTIKTFDKIPATKMIEKTRDYLCTENLSISTEDNYQSYNWFRRDSLISNEKSISINKPGTYSVAVIDNNNCFGEDSIEIFSRKIYSTPQICLVTVDDKINKNKLVWNKFSADSLAVINVLKESNQSNKYINLASVPVYSQGIFVDSSSAPDAKADRYMISLKDECGTITDTSELHKTMHLTSNLGVNGEINLSWSGYEGFSFDSYNLYRKTASSEFELLTTIQSSLESYTDMNPPKNKVFYQIEVVNPNNCNPNLLKAGTYNSSRSNIISRETTNSLPQDYSGNIKVSPNPAKDFFTITLQQQVNKPYKLIISDISGRVVVLRELIDIQTTIERGNLPNGLYLLSIEGEFNYKTKILLK